ncbi:MAG: hypothetical protein ABIM99_06340 [Candidatus Dojkabacteria bacterium]
MSLDDLEKIVVVAGTSFTLLAGIYTLIKKQKKKTRLSTDQPSKILQSIIYGTLVVFGLIGIVFLWIRSDIPNRRISAKEPNSTSGIDSFPKEKTAAAIEIKTKTWHQAEDFQQPLSTKVEPSWNGYLNEIEGKNEICVVVLDHNNHPISSITSQIANLYRSQARSVTTSLFSSRFFRSEYFMGLQNADTQVFNGLDLASHVNYVIIAQYSNEFDTGDYTKYISRATLDVRIISCTLKSQTDGFKITVANGFDDKAHAESGAIEKLLDNYRINYLNL